MYINNLSNIPFWLDKGDTTKKSIAEGHWYGLK